MTKNSNNLVDKDFWSNKNTSTKYIDVKKDESFSSIFKIIINLILILILIFWLSLILTDYLRTVNSKDPLFCYFNKKDIEYENGKVEECTGLGYKVIKYDLDENKRYELGPFWISNRINK